MPHYQCENCGQSYYSAANLSFDCKTCGNLVGDLISPRLEKNTYISFSEKFLGLISKKARENHEGV